MADRITARQMVHRVATRLFPDAGCSDGSCVFGHPGGMQTNGGCQCLKERDPVLLRRTVMRLADVARALAATVPADIYQRCVCESCGENSLCEYRDTTLVNATQPEGKGAWLCDECHDELRCRP
jgi:hypothetical protein